MDENPPPPDKQAPPIREEWERGCAEIRSLGDRILAELKRVYGEEYIYEKERISARYATMMSHAVSVEESVRYCARHLVFGGGSTDFAGSPFVDFPGDLSLRKYYEKILDDLARMPSKDETK